MSFLYLEGRRTTPSSQVQATSIYQFIIGLLVLVVGSLSITTMTFKEERDVAQARLKGRDESDVINGKYVIAFSNICLKVLNQKKDTRVAYLPFPGEVK